MPAILFGQVISRNELRNTNNLIRAHTVARDGGSGTNLTAASLNTDPAMNLDQQGSLGAATILAWRSNGVIRYTASLLNNGNFRITDSINGVNFLEYDDDLSYLVFAAASNHFNGAVYFDNDFFLTNPGSNAVPVAALVIGSDGKVQHGEVGATAATATNIVAALSAVTFDTIADMTNSTTVTNMNYAKAYSGTNGIGGGFFELMHTNGLVVNFGTIWPSKIPKKFLVRTVRSPINAQWFGAKGDGTTDDTIALQLWLNQITNGYKHALLPIGDYRITNTLSVTGYNAGDGWRLSGELGRPRSPGGSQIIWYGPTGGTMMQLMGVSGSTMENIILNAHNASPAKFCLTVDARNGEATNSSAISSGMKFKGVTFSGPVGADSTCVLLSHVSAVSPQIAEITWEDCNFSGTTGTDYLVRSLGAGNTKNFSFFNCLQSQATNGFYFLSGNGALRFENISGGNSRTNITTGPGCSLEVTSWYDEGSGMFLFQAPGGASSSSARISGLEWHGAALNTNDVIIYAGSHVTLMNSHLDNARTATSVGNILVDSPMITNNPAIRGGLLSFNNWFQNASVFPAYGIALGGGYEILTNQWFGHRAGGVYSGRNVAVESINDMGGIGGALIPFEPLRLGGGDIRANDLRVHGEVYLTNQGTNGSPSILVSRNPTTGLLEDTAPPVGGSGSGETNTASNLGGGLNIYDSKSGVDLRFNTFSNAGDGITISSNAGLFTINIDWSKVMSQTNATAMSNALVALIGGGSGFFVDDTNGVHRGTLALHGDEAAFQSIYGDGDELVFSWFAGTEDLDGYLALFSHRSQTYPIKVNTNGTVEILSAEFESMTVDTLTVLSNTVEFAGAGITFKALDPNLSQKWVNTNAPNGNIVADWQNLHKQTNNYLHVTWNGDYAGGTTRYVTNTFSAAIDSVPTLFSVNGGVPATTFTITLTNGYWTELSGPVHFYGGTNYVRVVTMHGAL